MPPCAVTAVVPHRIPRRALDSWRRTYPESAAHANADAAEDWNRTSAAYRSPLVAEVEEFVEAVHRWSKKCPRRAEAGRGCALVNKPQLGLFFSICDARLELLPTSEAKRHRRGHRAEKLTSGGLKKNQHFLLAAAKSLGAEIKDGKRFISDESIFPSRFAFLLQICSLKWLRASRKLHLLSYQRKLTTLRPFETVCTRLGMQVATCGCLDRSWHFYLKGRFCSINDAARRIFPYQLKQDHRLIYIYKHFGEDSCVPK